MSLSAIHSLWALRIGLLAVGMGAGLYLPSGIASLTKLAKPARWGTAIGIHDMAPNLSIVVAPAVAGILLGTVSWRGIYFLFGITAILVVLAFIHYGPTVSGRGQVPNPATLKRLFGNPSQWILCVLFSLGAAGLTSVYNMLPLYLTSVQGFEVSSANYIVALSRIPGIGTSIAAGWLTDIIGPRKALAWVLAVSGSLGVLLGLLSGPLLVGVVFLQAAAATCFFPAGLAAVARLFPYEMRNLSTAISVSFSGFVGSGLISAFLGFLADRGMFGTGLVINGILIMAGLPLLLFLRFEYDTRGG
jgi:NNP family nitrate/nitrite transporter-like MFS transporter